MASARLTALCALALLAASAFAVRLEVRTFSWRLCGPAERAAQNAPFFRDVENDVRLDAPTVSLSFNGTLTSAAADSAAAVRRSARVTIAHGVTAGGRRHGHDYRLGDGRGHGAGYR
jgi:hypothetical protein